MKLPLNEEYLSRIAGKPDAEFELLWAKAMGELEEKIDKGITAGASTLSR